MACALGERLCLWVCVREGLEPDGAGPGTFAADAAGRAVRRSRSRSCEQEKRRIK